MGNIAMKPEECGLLIVDVQGKLAEIVHNSDTMIATIEKLAKTCQLLNITTLLLEQNPKGLGSTTPKIRDCLGETKALEKFSFNALAEAHIKKQILALNKRYWLVVGIEAHICVLQTVQGLLKEGLQVQLITDGISSRMQSNRDLAIDNMRQMGAAISSLEMCLYQLMGNSQHTKFKEVLSIIK